MDLEIFVDSTKWNLQIFFILPNGNYKMRADLFTSSSAHPRPLPDFMNISGEFEPKIAHCRPLGNIFSQDKVLLPRKICRL